MGKIVIAHRGASGYLPEHSLAAKAMAHAMGADFIEQDLCLTKDDRLVVLHDIHIDRVTNVADIFPERKRKDGRYYVIDFTFDEIRQLKMTERFSVNKNQQRAVFPDRFPLWKSSFRVSSFEEEIELIQGLNKSTGKNIGIYPEIKSPAFHRFEGKDISRETLRVLKNYGYQTKQDLLFLQCFDYNELKRIHDELFPEFDMAAKLVQLITADGWEKAKEELNTNTTSRGHEKNLNPTIMEKIAEYADGIGPEKSMIVTNESTRNKLIITNMVNEAHETGLVVHPYTFRADSGEIPKYASSFEDMLNIFYFKAGVDGVFTDFPDRAGELLQRTDHRVNTKN